MATTPNFASTVKCWNGTVTTGDTGRGTAAPTNKSTIVTPGASGSRIDEITITAAGTSTANIVRLFINVSALYYLFQEVLTSAITPSASTASFTTTLSFNSFVLPSGSLLVATVNTTETYHITAFGGDF